MVEVNIIHRFSMDRDFSRGEFGEAVQDSGRDRAEGTGCVGSLLSDVL